MRSVARTGHILLVTSGLVAGVAVIGASIAAYSVNTGIAAPNEPQEPTGKDVALALGRVGITPANLAAAGVSQAQANTLLSAAESHFDAATFGALQTEDASVNTLTRRVSDLRTQIRAGQADCGTLSPIQTQLSTAKSGRDTVLGDLFDAATAALPSETIGLIQTLHANADRQVPISYRTAIRTDAEWTRLRTALANLDQAGRLDGVDADTVCSQLVSGCDSEPAVSRARTDLANNLAGINSAFAALVDSE